MKRILCIFVLLCLAVLAGCKRSENTTASIATSEPTATPTPMEAYIFPDDLPVRIKAKAADYVRVIIAAYAERAATAAATAAPKAKTQQVESLSLDPYTIGDETVYRVDGTDYLTLYPRVFSPDEVLATINSADRYKSIASAHPDVKCYAYAITRSQDLDWFEEKSGVSVYDYNKEYESMLDGSGIRYDRFEIESFDFYKETGYKTDFHVNYIGSDIVYGDLYNMMSADFDMGDRVMPSKTLHFDDLRILGDIVYYGADGKQNLRFYKDDGSLDESQLEMFSYDAYDEFVVYKYDLPEYTSYINDAETIIGLEEEYEAGMINRNPVLGHQFSYYGGQSGIVRIEFNQPDRPNLLMCSDSQGRPCRKVLASHFNTTIYLDGEQWRSEDIDAIIEQYDIDVILLIGQTSMFEDYR